MLLGAALIGCQPVASVPPVAEASAEIAGLSKTALAALDYVSVAEPHHDEGGRVRVELSAAWSTDGLLVIRGIFTPDDAGFHLYSSSLPKAGVNGLGRPTLIEVADPTEFSDVGPLVSDKRVQTHFDKTTNSSMQVYPDGAVTLYKGVRFSSLPTSATNIPVQLTYMTCSKARCYSPVEGAIAEITVPVPADTPEVP